MSSTDVKLCNQRLLSDIHELVTKPYPKIVLYPNENYINIACLILYPDHYPPLHLSIEFPSLYPIRPPSIWMNSSVQHPNVYGSFICASILRPGEEHTPAYTLKGIAIQLLSFFDSDSLEQEDYDKAADLTTYQQTSKSYLVDTYKCQECGFGAKSRPPRASTPLKPTSFDARVHQSPEQWPIIQSSASSPSALKSSAASGKEISPPSSPSKRHSLSISDHEREPSGVEINQLPNEILLLIIEHLDDFEDLTSFARAWPRISQVVRDFNVIRQREQQCFCLKKTYQQASLGVGVRINKGQISSEFDLISQEACNYLHVNRSIHNIPFNIWLPLPISRRHWNKVRKDAHAAFLEIASRINVSVSSDTMGASVLFTFMNDIVVRLNQTTENLEAGIAKKHTLRHASEKAIESYFHLFHLLVCIATEDPCIVQKANKLLEDFKNGARSKKDCPNLGHLLIALLISDVQVTDTLLKAIITEAIVRNVVWLLDRKGAGMDELSYMERDSVSAYRLDKTFQGSRTSYRLLMFSELFRRTARPSHEKSLTQVRDELFNRHGGPPIDAAGHLAAEVRRLHTIDNFPAFMREMGLQQIPTPANFTHVLRNTVHESMARGYSRWAIDQKLAMRLRLQKDPYILLTPAERTPATWLDHKPAGGRRGYNFFPNRLQR
ncbi:hypothetical protein F5B22DRAFT_595935 [Xylaria bambusicola]|uniref:uncharacterized protein n=1 Tax=Xylaria bambusicola TaxID=326684 RepID=UPI00200769C7|nr:uncharacterized protein F5B22DRAFT_595935 [Xylaria bambusicola]KAI0521708.1 hypothetical protein F5B22DRAFT_595935 [Xylaria bambusicola]